MERSRKTGFIIALVVGVALVGIFFRACSPSLVHGTMLDTALVTDSHGKQLVWILTDDSFHYNVKSGGSTGSGSLHCFACKTWTYLYDPVAQKVIKRTKTSLDGPVLRGSIFQSGSKVWVVLPAYSGSDPRVEQYNADTGERELDTEGFVARFPELSAGLVDARHEGKRIKLATKDGRDGIMYDFVADRIVPKDSYVRTPAFAELKDGKDAPARKELVHLMYDETGNVRSEPIGSRVYLEGIIYYQDEKCAAIIHLDQVGKKSNRLLTLVDVQAEKELWTAPQAELFSNMKIDEGSNTFSSLFFTKGDINVWRAGDAIVLEYSKVGVMAFDYSTGKRLWVVYP